MWKLKPSFIKYEVCANVQLSDMVIGELSSPRAHNAGRDGLQNLVIKIKKETKAEIKIENTSTRYTAEIKQMINTESPHHVIKSPEDSEA